ncbi:hypothetical protein MMC17_002206 [Xylographa soralifera]|nr:hypothetical protein [Xylographa soralifera]
MLKYFTTVTLTLYGLFSVYTQKFQPLLSNENSLAMEELTPASSSSSFGTAEMQDLVKVNKALKHTMIDIARLVRDASNVEEQAPAVQPIEETNRETVQNTTAFSSPFSPQNGSEIKRRRQEYRDRWTPADNAVQSKQYCSYPGNGMRKSLEWMEAMFSEESGDVWEIPPDLEDDIHTTFCEDSWSLSARRSASERDYFGTRIEFEHSYGFKLWIIARRLGNALFKQHTWRYLGKNFDGLNGLSSEEGFVRLFLEVAMFIQYSDDQTDFVGGYLAKLRASCLARGLINDQIILKWYDFGISDPTMFHNQMLLRMHSALDYRICRPEVLQLPLMAYEEALLNCRTRSHLRDTISFIDSQSAFMVQQTFQFSEVVTSSPESIVHRSGLELAAGMSFSPSCLSLHSLTELGGLQIKWTLEWQKHLMLDVSGAYLYLYQLPSFIQNGTLFRSSLGAQEDFRLLMNTYSLILSSYEMDTRSYTALRGQLKAELKETLHSVSPYPQACHFRCDLTSPTAKAFFKPFFSMPIPQHWARYLNIDRRNQKLSWESADRLENPSPLESAGLTVMDAVKNGQPFIEDMCLMMIAVIEKDRNDIRGYADFGPFEDRVRELKTFLDSRKPRTLRQLWKDARDATSWWSFWLVVLFGCLGTFLAFASLAMSIAQTVGTFKSLH